MGEGLFDQVDEFRAVESEVDALLGFSIRDLCLNDPDARLNQTQYTQPALYVVNALNWYRAVANGDRPQFIAGHSLGEYNALLAAGVFDLLTGLKLVKRRGELMAQARNGSMTAVTGMESAKVGSVLRTEGLQSLDVANFNSPTQTVIAGPVEDLKRAAPLLEKAGAQMCVPLPVSGAFHSRYMVPAAREFELFISDMEFKATQLPVISNVTARPYPVGTPTATVRSLLVKQISQPVRWVQSVLYLRHAGVTKFREMSAGTVLMKLVDQIKT